uniref:Uncharacterized protein n=1 Tax=Setaria digitata TaxID=48799 RepID=A0A915PJ09_9BILA
MGASLNQPCRVQDDGPMGCKLLLVRRRVFKSVVKSQSSTLELPLKLKILNLVEIDRTRDGFSLRGNLQGAAWLSSARAVRCEEGGDDVKSARPLRPGLHTCYNGRYKGLLPGDRMLISKVDLSSDRSLQLDSVKLDSLVIVDQQRYGEYVPGPCTHRPSSHGSWGCLKFVTILIYDDIILFVELENAYGGLAQLARALALHARGHRFDSDILHTIQLSILQRRQTRRTETSKYPEEKKTIVIPLVVAIEKGRAQTNIVSAILGL